MMPGAAIAIRDTLVLIIASVSNFSVERTSSRLLCGLDTPGTGVRSDMACRNILPLRVQGAVPS